MMHTTYLSVLSFAVDVHREFASVLKGLSPIAWLSLPGDSYVFAMH